MFFGFLGFCFFVFVLFFETGFFLVDQAGLEVRSDSAGIKGVHYQPQL